MKIHTLDLDFLGVREAIAVFVVEGPEGLALVECGPYSVWENLQTALRQNGFDVRAIRHVFLSHIHFDHAGAAWALAETGAQIYVHPVGLPHLASPEKLYNSARQIYGDQMDRLWGAMHPIPTDQLNAPQHGETIEAAGLKFTAWYTPGHAVHHIAWMAESTDGAEKTLFTGDVAGVRIEAGMPVMPPCPPPDINVEDWRASIELMRNLPVNDLYLTHFGRVTDKLEHLNSLERRLLEWAEWMRPHYEAQTPQPEIVPLFMAYVEGQLRAEGVGDEGIRQYETANPAFMSVAGLMRYWHKKLRV